MKKTHLTIAGLFAGMLVLAIVFGSALHASKASAANVALQLTTPTPNSYQFENFFTATTTSATSTNITGGGGYLPIAGAKHVTFYFSRGGAYSANTGSSKFEVEVTPDGTNWYDFSRLYLMDTSKTATSTVWITAATSTVVASMDLDNQTFFGVRCQVVEITDGEHTCKAAVDF